MGMVNVSCSSEDENLFVDDKPCNLDELKDKTTAPGDDFFRYCNGAWYDATNVPDSVGRHGFFATDQTENARTMLKEQATKPTLPFLQTMKADFDRRKETKEADIAAIRNYMDAMNDMTTMNDLLQYAGQLMKKNIPSLATLSFFVQNKKAKCELDYDQAQVVTITADVLIQFGYTPEEAQKMLANATTVSKALQSVMAMPQSLMERLNKPITDEQYKLAMAHKGSRAATDDNISVILSGIGLTRNELYDDIQYETTYYDFINKLTDTHVPVVKDYMKLVIAQTLMQDTALDTKATFASEVQHNPMMQHALGKLFVETYMSSETKQYIAQMCENIRTSLINRVQKLDWMVDNTKRAAAEKVADMKFFCCYPEKWNDALVNPTVSSQSFLLDDLELAQQIYGVLISDCGRSDDDAIWDILQTALPLHEINAAYLPSTNFIIITSAISCAPLVDTTKSDAYNYGILGMIVGHEMTHGLDSNGSKRDKDGNYFDWWTMDDKLKFKERQQMLINVYNNLVIMPGVYQNGERTLGENIADLGGALASYDSFLALRKSQDCRGDELDAQKKLFLESYASLWREKRTPKFCLQMQKLDVHSDPIARINGVVSNFPDWYKLYDVRSNNKLYLAPERRVSIW